MLTVHTEFAVGQRYLSDTEPELGLGIVVDVDTRRVHIMFPQSEEARVYSKESAPLSRVAFKPKDWITTQDGQRYQVTAVDEVMGVLKYTVAGLDRPIMETKLAANISLAKPLDRLLASRLENNEWYQLRQEILRTQAALHRHPLRGLMGPRVDIIPHQLYIAHEVGKRLAPRVLLADEVGLGKTIEAGLIIHQQLLSGRSERVLILVPDSLQFQWLVEMRRRFNLAFTLMDLARTAEIKSSDPEQNPFLSAQHILCTLSLLTDHPDLRDQALAAGFDLLVVDEAHHLYCDNSQSEQTSIDSAYGVVEAFAQQTDGVLLLTATPEQLGIESHFARLQLLDPDKYQDIDDFIEESHAFSQVAQIAEILIAHEPLSESQLTSLEHLLGHPVDNDTEGWQQALKELIDRHGTGRVLYRNTRDSIDGFLGRQFLAYPLTQNIVECSDSVTAQLYPETKLDIETWLQHEPKVSWLIEILKTTLKQEKVLLIARSGELIEVLEQHLRLVEGIKTTVFTEQMSLLERDQAAAYFADEMGAQVLLCSEVGSEGRNFQFAHHLILFDLPAYPDTLEQRIGRLDRIGQTQQITLHIPYHQGTAQERLFRWYHQGLALFEQVSPAAQTVQDQLIDELKQAFRFELSDQEFEALLIKAAQMREQLQAQMQQGRDRLLEYHSCDPSQSHKLVSLMRKHDDNIGLLDFLTRFLSAVNIDYQEQRNDTIIIHDNEDKLIDQLSIPEEGMTVTFDREFALAREDIDFMSYEHPLMQQIFELVNTGPFGNTNVAILESAVVPEGSLLLSFNFRVEVIAPKSYNLAASLPQQSIRVLLGENGQDYSQKISADMLSPHVRRIDTNRARKIVKLRQDIIKQRYEQGADIAAAQIDTIKAKAKETFGRKLQQEIDRLTYLSDINAAVNHREINRLVDMQQRGIERLDQLALIPDAIQILVAMPPAR